MKKLLYIVGLSVSLMGLSACKKDDDPEPAPAVVGSWTLERVRFSGYPAPYTSLNADLTSAQYGLSGSFTVKADKTFTDTFSANGQIVDSDGTWEFTNNQLQLKYDTGDDETYDLDATRDPAKLVSTAIAATDSLRNPQTSAVEAVPFQFQFVYSKQP